MKRIYQLSMLMITLVIGLSGCEETIWPEVDTVNTNEYAGIWVADNYRMKTTYVRTQDPVTKDFSVEETTVVDTREMVFDIAEKTIRVTTTEYRDGVAQTPVVRDGFYSLAMTKANDYKGKAIYMNVWQNEGSMHTSFANPIAEPYTSYTVVRKSATEMELSWVLYNNTAHSSAKYTVVLKKSQQI